MTCSVSLSQAAGAEADEDSEALADSFLKSDCDVDEFLKSFMVRQACPVLISYPNHVLMNCSPWNTRKSARRHT